MKLIKAAILSAMFFTASAHAFDSEMVAMIALKMCTDDRPTAQKAIDAVMGVDYIYGTNDATLLATKLMGCHPGLREEVAIVIASMGTN